MTIPWSNQQALTLKCAPHRFVAMAVCVAALALTGIASAQSRDTLGEGDSIRVTVFQNPDLTTDGRISEQGTVTFPMIGEVAIAGLTPAAAEKRIAQMLEQGKFVLKPQVNLSVTRIRSRQVTVLGQVTRPGRYPLEDPTSGVTDILALAGGVVPTGDENVIVVVSRDGKNRRVDVNVPGMVKNGDFAPNIQLANGDTIYVQRAPVFYIYGEVQRAGSYRLEPVMTVMQAIAVGGGITPRGTERGVKIRRRGPGGTLQTLDASLTDPLVADDVVYVNESLF
jgi:polysaccharide export outer membrane protein